MRSFCLLLAGFLGLAYVASGQTPGLSSLIPTSLPAGGPSFTLRVFGSNFPNNASVTWNGTSLVTFVANSGLLETTVPASLIASPGTASVSVVGALTSLTFTITGSSSLAVTTTSLPNGTVGQAYLQNGNPVQLAASGGTPPYTWSISAGALPAGMGLSSGGSFSGVPTTSGASSFTVQVTDSAHSTATAMLSITVNAPAFAITTASLPGGMVGQAYLQNGNPVQLAASGGTPPYHWSGQSLPAGLSINASTGVLSGTPTASGNFTFTIQATDSASTPAMASQSYTITIAAPPLTINTLSPLPNATVGLPYAVTLTVSGGTSPYTWSITSGSVSGLSLVSTTGVLQGTPAAAGAFSLTIRVTDSSQPPSQASQNFSLTVNPPAVNIISISPPPNGAVGVAYNPSQQPQFSVVGGTPPYTWSASGLPPGLNINATSGVLTGTPTTAGTFSITLQATDSSAPPITGTRTFSITIATGLSITTATQLPDTTLGSAFSYTMTAAGGAPPYTWSANGLPSGLSINASTGVISGTTASAGTISFAVTVVDSAQASASARFNINVMPLPLPAIAITGLPNTATPLQQYSISLTLASAYPSADISGTVILTSAPADNGPNDTSIQFSSGGQSASFTIPAGSTTPTGTLKIQVGTVAGTITVTMAHVLVGGFDVTPSPAPAASTQIAAAAPVITSATTSVNGSTLTVRIAGYAASREVTQATFNFSAATGQSLASSQFNIPVDSIFSPYYQNGANAAFGSQFIFTQPFTIQGNAGDVIPQSVTLTNRIGSTTASVTH